MIDSPGSRRSQKALGSARHEVEPELAYLSTKDLEAASSRPRVNRASRANREPAPSLGSASWLQLLYASRNVTHSSHPTRPNIMLSLEEIDSVAAYIAGHSRK